jgi:hypothetical protein
MYARRKTRALARTALLALLTLTPVAYAAAQSPTPQPEPPRKPHGPVAGPVIKLPPGAGAEDARAQTPGANEAEAARAAWAPQKWEYCVINGFKYQQKGFGPSSPRTPSAIVRYFPNGSEVIEGPSEEEALGNAFAKLGEEGWELTGVRPDLSLSDGNGTSRAVYFFKRPKQ